MLFLLLYYVGYIMFPTSPVVGSVLTGSVILYAFGLAYVLHSNRIKQKLSV